MPPALNLWEILCVSSGYPLVFRHNRGHNILVVLQTDAPQIEEVFENVQYVKLEFIDYMYRDAKKRLIGYIRDHGLRQQDLEGCLGDLLDEEWYKINM